MPTTHVQHLRYKHDRNGNPQRLWIFYNDFGVIVKIKEEGYSGRPSKEINEQKLIELPELDITKEEYLRIQKYGETNDIYERSM